MDEHHDLVLGGFFGMLAIALPVLFHLVGLGRFFLPMFLPILMLGFLVRWSTAVQVGAAVPIISGLLTGMPPFYPPIAPIMSCEGAALAGVAALCYRRWGMGLWPSLLLAIAAERLVMVILMLVLSEAFQLMTGVVVTAKVAAGVPGIVLQIVLVPYVVRRLEARYPAPVRERSGG